LSNQDGDERGLVVYHNKFAETAGWIKTSAAYMDKEAGHLVQRTVAEGLGLPPEGYAIFRDYVSHLEYIRPCAEMREKGIYVHLAAYQCHAFLDWRFVQGENWGTVNSRLNGGGVASIQSVYDELFPQQEPATGEPVKPKRKRAPRKKATEEKALPAEAPIGAKKAGGTGRKRADKAQSG
jgi:hypothetical protein